ncbi:hypothetical protein M493_15895 [Geobacillus genomosp. 3]|uniref:ABC transporter domain-containing protein n=1 Tax=Geobacillus genomosp. 3 TaxID=1921421 RepID=S5ZGE5_GEOG3|nr:ATP-binding cassette domain-containing protein [Geobacillus genomosp. 3]AGT33395.1 hypothetical protein M493_15895 [Geobacillus genomosp. 3]
MKRKPLHPHVRLANVRKCYGTAAVLNGLDLDIYAGEFLAIVGKSGCGKSTLLRLVSGLETPDEGAIVMDGKPLDGVNAHARIMFQDGRLLPWKTVLDNVSLGLGPGGREAAAAALQSVGLGERLHDWPANLSGGQKQRVALARALVHEPRLLLLDEPLGALDALTRLEMQALIEDIWIEKRITSLLVTHDVEEAVALADRVILLQNGGIALDLPVPLPRPRERSHPAFSALVGHLLRQIMGRQTEQPLTIY